MESSIKDRYLLKQHENGHTDLKVTSSGLAVGKHEDGFLAASPDGLVHDPSADNTKGLLEMKYIQTEEEESIEQALLKKLMCTRSGDVLS